MNVIDCTRDTNAKYTCYNHLTALLAALSSVQIILNGDVTNKDDDVTCLPHVTLLIYEANTWK